MSASPARHDSRKRLPAAPAPTAEPPSPATAPLLDPGAASAAAPVDTRVSSMATEAGSTGSRERIPVGPGGVGLAYGAPAAWYPVSDPPSRPSKTRPPELREDVLSRTRLLDWLDAKIHRRVVAVVADAGYGKTTLLADFSRHTRLRTIWYRLDQEDADVVTFVRYLHASCREVAPGFGEATAALLRDVGGLGSPPEVLVDTMARDLASLSDQPSVLILDDVHALDRVPDVQRALREIVTRAPDRLTVVLSGRRKPPVSLARLRTLGEVADLTADDLRFDHAETETLFRETYQRPLDRETLAALETRTEGWAASLHLVRAAIRDRSDVEVRRFIRGLTAAQGPLHDYLAEEVVGDLEPALQSYLMRTALLVEVEPDGAAAAAEVEPVVIEEHGVAAERLGLLSRPAGRGGSGARRYHPLVQEFLVARLRREVGTDGIQAIHRRIATAAEGSDWRRAAHHYAEAGDTDDLHRVLVAATRSIMSTGDYAIAEGFIHRLPPSDDIPWFDIVLSRRALQAGRVDEALTRARRAVDSFEAEGSDRHFAVANLMSMAYYSGDEGLASQLSASLVQQEADQIVDAIARGTAALIEAARGGDLLILESRLRAIASVLRQASGGHYLGVTMLNLACVYRARGDAERALECADDALEAFGDSAASAERSSSHLVRGWALAHLGRREEAAPELDAGLSLVRDSVPHEAIAEFTDILGSYFDSEDAQERIDALAGKPRPNWEAGDHLLALAKAENLTRLGDYAGAADCLADAATDPMTLDVSYRSRRAAAIATLAALRDDPDAVALSDLAIAEARCQNADFYETKASLAQGVALRDGPALSRRVLIAAEPHPSAITAFAEIISCRPTLLNEDATRTFTEQMLAGPKRWAQSLRPTVRARDGMEALAAARLLERVGERRDVSLLREAGRRHRRAREFDPVAVRVARRVAPRVVVHDLGPVSVDVGDRHILSSDVRRKVLSLVCFLATRPGLTATRDQALEALWPDLAPEPGSNSLNQTVYFLRRVFEEDYREETSPGYVFSDQEMIRLDAHLVDTDATACLRLLRAVGASADISVVSELSERYRGRFALDFEYEDWASSFRNDLHARYLETLERTILSLTQIGDYSSAIRLAHRVLAVDPDAENVELATIRLYRAMGSLAAAAERYARYAETMRSEYGTAVPPLDQL
jgi:DNA-binding SARP family transcriptional activator